MKRWPLLLLVFTCAPCLGLCGWSAARMNKENRVREVRGDAALRALELFHADAGSWPERLDQVISSEKGRESLSYERCPKTGDFQLSFIEAPPGFLPSDYERTWEPARKSWIPHDRGQRLPCE